MSYYNPFTKSIGETLTHDDLIELIKNEVAEGFFVEYKETFVDSKKIARSIASFANTYGGWYFIGVKADREKNKAVALPGIELASYSDPLSRVSDPARNILSHMPLMFPQLVKVSETHAVVAVYIPESNDTPFITNEGKIYRRSGDASDPVPETSKHIVDNLVEKADKQRERFTKFCQDTRRFSNDESAGWINLYFRPSPLGITETKGLLNSDTINELLKQSQLPIDLGFGEAQITANVPFVSGHTFGRSVVLRQLINQREAYNSLSIELFLDGSAKIHVPLDQVSSHRLEDFSFGTDNVKNYIYSLYENGFDSEHLLYFVPFGKALVTCAILVRFYENWLKTSGWKHSLLVRVTLEKLWRSVAIFSCDKWIEVCKATAIPVIPSDSISFPPLEHNPMLLDYDEESLWTSIMIYIAFCIGLPTEALAIVYAEELVHAIREQHPEKFTS